MPLRETWIQAVGVRWYRPASRRAGCRGARPYRPDYRTRSALAGWVHRR